MAIVQAYTKSGVDAKFNSRSNMTMVHNGGGSPDLSAYPDSKTGDIIERASDGARWGVVASSINPIAGRVVSVAGKTGLVTLGPGDVGAAPSSHTHTKAHITDLNASTSATANSIAQRGTGGVLVVGTPTATTHATTKAYVDGRITGGITWANLSGKPTTFTPSAHTHTISQITDLTVGSTNVANTVPTRDANGRFSVANPAEALEVANKGYVDGAITSGTTWAKTSGKPSTFPPSAHTHTMANITNLPAVATTVTNSAIVQRTSTGQVSVPTTPVGTQDAASKKYVDDTVTAGATWSSLSGKPSTFTPSTHTHTVAQVTGLTLAVPATASTTALRGTDGTIITADPTLDTHAATKKYVDDKVGEPISWANLTGKPSTFAPSTHNHTKSQITDLNASTSATADSIAQRGTGGVLVVGTPTATTHATTKTYVDSAVTAAKAWSAITGKPSTFAPSTHSHTQAQVTGLPAKITTYDATTAKVNAAVSSVSGSTTDSGKLVVLTSTGRLGAVDPSGATDVANKQYVDAQITAGTTWAKTSGKPTTFPPSSHTHTVAQISNLTLSQTATGSSVVQRDSSGRATVATPTATGHATTKAYVDNAVTAGKAWANLTGKPSTFAPSTHTHTASQITDLNAVSTTTINTIVKRDAYARFQVLTPVNPTHPANKSYVDARPAIFSGSGVPTTTIPGSVIGDMYLDTATMELYNITEV